MTQQPPSGSDNADLLLYAGMLNRWIGGKGMNGKPFKALAGDIMRTLNVLGGIQAKRKLAQMKIDLLKQRVEKMEAAMEAGTQQPYGHRLDKRR